jgi:hypothetical protein
MILRHEIKEAVAVLRQEMHEQIAALRNELHEEVAALRNEIADFKADLMRWMFGIAGVQVVLIDTLVKLL